LFCKFCNGWIIDALDELNDPSPGMWNPFVALIVCQAIVYSNALKIIEYADVKLNSHIN
jgi:hypothetical protein